MNSSLGTKRFKFTIRSLLKRPVFEKGASNWVDIVSVITKQYKNRIHFSNNPKPAKVSLSKE